MRILPALAALALPFLASSAAGSAGTDAPASPPTANSMLAGMRAQGLAFAQARCSACHAVVPLRVSPNPEAPTFEEIVSKPGLTRKTLRTFLRDSHNFPDKMNFTIVPSQIRNLTDYMMTLRKVD